jgi:hypothetical protein
MRRAQCSCGQLRVTCEGEPVRVSMCHCHACQRRTGSVFGVQTRWPSASVAIEGTSTEYVRTAESGNRVHLHFCPTCGSTVYFTIEAYPGVTAVAMGAFADNTLPPPTVSVYEEFKHAWVRAPEGAEILR